MIYIPDEWLINKDNLQKVHDILSSEFHTDINLSSRIAGTVERLRDIGELNIVAKLQNNEIILPS